MKASDRALLQAKLATADTSDEAPPAMVIVMANAIHLGDLALKYLDGYPRVFGIGNGLADWEAAAVHKGHSGEVVRLSRIYEHSQIIDALTDVMTVPFWLIDHDCYIRDREVLSAPTVDITDRAGEALFSTTNRATRLTVPETFLLRLNPRVLKALQRKYDVSAKQYWWSTLPAPARERLNAMGVSDARMPEPQKDYFDTLRVVALLAESEGRGIRITRDYTAHCAQHPDVVHIGATSWPNWPPADRYQALGAYFWSRCLETCGIARAQSEYRAQWPDVPLADDMRRALLGSGLFQRDDPAGLLDLLDRIAVGG